MVIGIFRSCGNLERSPYHVDFPLKIVIGNDWRHNGKTFERVAYFGDVLVGTAHLDNRGRDGFPLTFGTHTTRCELDKR